MALGGWPERCGINTIATINFKGGVGKTTATWSLGHVAALAPKTSSIVFDLDAQMSLTQAIALNEDGSAFKNFSDWYERSIKKNRNGTLLDFEFRKLMIVGGK